MINAAKVCLLEQELSYWSSVHPRSRGGMPSCIFMQCVSVVLYFGGFWRVYKETRNA